MARPLTVNDPDNARVPSPVPALLTRIKSHPVPAVPAFVLLISQR